VVFAISFAVLALSHCAPVTRESTSLKATIKPGEFAGEIRRLDGIAQGHGDPSTRAAAHLQLAVLYSSYNNPSPDYSLALRELETYVSLKPEKVKDYEIANWLALLRELRKLENEMDGLKQRIDHLVRSEKELKEAEKKREKENRELRESEKELREAEKKKEKENRELRETVDQLKALDVQMEEKRKQVK